MKKIALLFLAFLTVGVFAQEAAAPVETEENASVDTQDTAATGSVAATDPATDDAAATESEEETQYIDRSAQVDVEKIGTDQKASDVKTFVLDQFNITTGWEAVIFPDTATASLKYIDRPDKPDANSEGASEENSGDGSDAASEENSGSGKLDITGEAAVPEDRSVVLGAKINFTRRAYGEEFFLKRSTPIRVEGITKAFSLWVCGRGMNHELYVRVQTPTGMIADIPFENPKLNFIGWKQLVAYVPPTVVQEDAMAPDKPGFMVLGLVLKFNAEEMTRDYYIYFDDLEAYTDVVHLAQYSGIENMSDEW